MKRIAAVLIALVLIFGSASAEWIMCDGYVNLRTGPRKSGKAVGYLDSGDEFETDGKTKNGFIRVLDAGETESWVFTGYVTDEKPEKIGERYVCTAKNRVACRRWIDGPQIKGKTGWLYNGTNVKVYWRTGEWSVTSRGYIQSEWLEADPE